MHKPRTGRLGLAAATTALAIFLTGCGSDSEGETGPTTTTPPAFSETGAPDAPEKAADGPSEIPEATPGTPEIVFDDEGKPDYCANQAPATGPAAKEFGGKKVLKAYCDMVTLTMENTYNPNLLRPTEDRKPVEFSGMEEYMTANMRASWQNTVDAYVEDSDSEKSEGVHPLMFTDVTNPKMVFPEDPSTPVVYNKRFSGGNTDVIRDTVGPNRLWLSFDIDADLLMVDKKTRKQYFLPLGKTISYWLKPSASQDTPWLIDGYRADYRVGDRRQPGPAPKKRG